MNFIFAGRILLISLLVCGGGSILVGIGGMFCKKTNSICLAMDVIDFGLASTLILFGCAIALAVLYCFIG